MNTTKLYLLRADISMAGIKVTGRTVDAIIIKNEAGEVIKLSARKPAKSKEYIPMYSITDLQNAPIVPVKGSLAYVIGVPLDPAFGFKGQSSIRKAYARLVGEVRKEAYNEKERLFKSWTDSIVLYANVLDRKVSVKKDLQYK